MGQSDYLPPGLPHNRCEWPQEFRDLENLDMRASGLIKNIVLKKITRGSVEQQIKQVEERYRDHFKARLNYWLEYYVNRGKTK